MTWECFWTDPTAQKMFKAHMLKMVSRVNTVNGRLWRYAPSAFSDLVDLRGGHRPQCSFMAWNNGFHQYIS